MASPDRPSVPVIATSVIVRTLLPEDDPAMQLRLKRQLMGLVSYLMFLAPLLYSVHFGWMDFGYAGLGLFCIVAVAINLMFFLAIRSGYSRRYADPSLTLPQIMVAIALALLMIRYAGEARTVLLMLFFTGFFFGIFALNTRQMLGLAAFAIVGYAAVIGQQLWAQQASAEALHLELLRFLTLVMVLVWLSLLGGYVARLRAKLAHSLVRMQALVSHDELTGAFNRRHLIDILHREKERADRFEHSFSVAILDLDHFKRINDNLGHAAGDDVLREFSERMHANARRIDWLGRQDADNTFGRYGGEEFLLVLPHTPLAGAGLCLERLRARVQAETFRTVAGPVEVTFSAGVAEYRHGEPVEATLSRADQALYRAKAAGRNRSELDPGGPA